MPPIYDYKCEACDDTFEHEQSMSSPKLKKCAKCGEPKLKRLISKGAGFILKGQNWPGRDIKRKNEEKKK